MPQCIVCKEKISLLAYKYKDENGNLYCKKCFSKFGKEKAKLEEYRQQMEQNEKRQLKKVLEINDQWEYKVVEIRPQRGAWQATDVKIGKSDTSFLNKLGQEGWELVNSFSIQGISAGLGMHAQGATTSIAFVFRRRISKRKNKH